LINSSDDVAAVSSSSAFFDNLIPQNMSTLEIPVTEGTLPGMYFCHLRKREDGNTKLKKPGRIWSTPANDYLLNARPTPLSCNVYMYFVNTL